LFNAATEALEAAQAIHSFLERWSVDVFLAVVALDVFLHLTEDVARMEWRAVWRRHSFGRLRLPAYSGRISVRAIAKTLSLIGFGVAIALEFVAVPYGERVDELTGKEADRSQKQLVAALVVAGNANSEAGTARAQASSTALRAGRLEKAAATLRRQAEDDRLARVKIQERLAWRTLSRLQATQIRDGFCAISARPPIGMHAVVGNEEAKEYTDAIATAIRGCAGFTVTAEYDAVSPIPGLSVVSMPRMEPELTPVRAAIRTIFERAKIVPASDFPVAGGVNLGITIFVGQKPTTDDIPAQTSAIPGAGTRP